MLDQKLDTIDTATAIENEVPAAAVENAPAVAQGSTAVAPADAIQTLRSLVGRFAAMEIGDNGILPRDATVPCTINSGNICFGENLKHNFGDFVDIAPVNITPYVKLDLGVGTPNEDQKKLMLACYDGKTVTTEEEVMSADDYMAHIRKQYPKASWKKRAVIHAKYLGSDRHDKVKDEVADDDILAIYLSPSSKKALDAFLVKSDLMNPAFGYLRLSKVTESTKTMTWTHFKFERQPAAQRQAA